MTWQRTVHSDTLEPYLAPDRPALGDEIVFRVRVRADAPPLRVFVRLIIDGVDHHVEASLEGEGRRFRRYAATTRLLQRRTHYHFLLRTPDDRTWYYNRYGLHAVYPDEAFDVDHHVPRWVSESVFYQIFPDRFCRGNPALGVRDSELERGRFTSREMAWSDRPLPYPEGGSLDFFNGDLPGIEAKLDYLAGLGVNALYLTPIFTAGTNHRYDCLDYFSVDPHLGGDAALVSLIRAAHERGMRLLLDVSLNHVSADHAWVTADPGRAEAGFALRDEEGSVVHWAGVADLVRLDYSSEPLRLRIYGDADSVVQRYLLKPFGIDGWRFDVASETGRYREAQDQCHEVWRHIRRVVRSINPDAYLVGEHWHDSSAYLQGDQWDTAMNYFGSGRPARMWAGEGDRFATVPSRDAGVGRPISGNELAVLLSQHFDRIPSAAVHGQFNLLDSHDVTRLHTNPHVFDWRVYEGVMMLMFMLPGTFSVYYGDEVGLSGTTDGDHGKRHPMRWDRSDHDERFVVLHRRMITLKRTSAALQRGSHRVLEAGANHLWYARFDESEAVVLLLNRDAHRTRFTVDLSLLGPGRVRVIGSAGEAALDGSLLSVVAEPRCSVLLRCDLED